MKSHDSCRTRQYRPVKAVTISQVFCVGGQGPYHSRPEGHAQADGGGVVLHAPVCHLQHLGVEGSNGNAGTGLPFQVEVVCVQERLCAFNKHQSADQCNLLAVDWQTFFSRLPKPPSVRSTSRLSGATHSFFPGLGGFDSVLIGLTPRLALRSSLIPQRIRFRRWLSVKMSETDKKKCSVAEDVAAERSQPIWGRHMS